jgi:transmembrane sensor
LGTSFDILAYPDDETLEVIVETGTVEMTRKNRGTSDISGNILIHQGEKGTFFQSENKLEKSLNRDANYLAWKTQNLKFDNSNLDEVTACLERIYHVDIELQNDNLKSLKLTAEFEKKSVDFVLNVIKLTFGLELTRIGDQYIFSEKTRNKQNNE